MRHVRQLSVLLTILLCMPAVFAQLYVDGSYSGSTAQMSCTTSAKYMSGAVNWAIDYDWSVTAKATVSGPRSDTSAATNYGQSSTAASVTNGGYGTIPDGCYYFDADGLATNWDTGQSSPPQGGRIGSLCFDDPTPPPLPNVWLFIYSNTGGSVVLLSSNPYPPGTQVTLTAVPPNDWHFVGWSGDRTSLDNPFSFYFSLDVSITANFEQDAPPPPPPPGPIEQSPTCPIILDLNGDGIRTTGLDDPVRFWIDLQGRIQTTAWTDPVSEEAFLWMDLNHDHTAQVTELFGARMLGPDGQYFPNGYEAIEQYDSQPFGGNDDGQITRKDRVWGDLKLWVDRNHDAVSQKAEISELEDHDIVALNLDYRHGYTHDVYGNKMYLVSSYTVRIKGHDGNQSGDNKDPKTEERLMADIEFMFIPNP